MKKLVQWSLKQALNKLALISFVVANVSPAFGQSVATSAYYIPMAPAVFADPTLIMQNQATLNIYGQQGNSLGELTPGSIFETQMSRNPFHYVMTQPTLSYPAMLNTAVQMPTAMGPMIPGTLEQTAMMSNGTTLPMNTNFYIPPADFSYQQIRAIGARADSNDEDINRLVEELIFADEKQDHDHFLKDDDENDADFTSSGKTRSYSARPYGTSFYSRTYERSQIAARATPSSEAQVQTEDAVISNSPFKILGPTCGCRDKGMSCVYNRANGGRNMFKGVRGNGHGGTRTHDGIDIAARTGTPIIAAADGTVTRIMDQGNKGYGRRIDITHVDSFMTRYAHLSRWIVRPGQKVKKGQLIGYSGNSGASHGAHLHFETCKLRRGEDRCNDSNVVNPLNYMASGSNQQKQLNLSCTEAAALGAANSSSSSSSSGSARAAYSGRAAQ